MKLTKEMTIRHRYVHLPVKNGMQDKRTVRFFVDDKEVRVFEIELAEGRPDWWAFVDVSPFKGRKLLIEATGPDTEADVLEPVCQSDSIKDADGLYQEEHRQQFHFSSRRGWLNDPNGLVYYQGEYHLFYQHNPYGVLWGNMHWGHAVSPDLFHWQELPVAIYKRGLKDDAFSGSATVDWDNTAGFQTGKEAVLVAAYTSTGRGECIAYSNDRGRTWTDYEGNPVVEHRGRDPKIIWHQPTKKWVMAVYEQQESDGIAFYTSENLKDWTFQSWIEGFHECPELFELPVDGDPDNQKWVIYAGNNRYRIGHFDGQTFIPETETLPGNRGPHLYAAQTFSNIPAEDGRRIQIGWGTSGEQFPTLPGMPFNQHMTVPCELTLRTTPDGIRLCSYPVKELERLRGKKRSWEGLTLTPGENPLGELEGDLHDIEARFHVDRSAELGFKVHGWTITYQAAQKQFVADSADLSFPADPVDGKIRVRLLIDRNSAEFFINGGVVAMTFHKKDFEKPGPLEMFTNQSPVKLDPLEAYELPSVWG